MSEPEAPRPADEAPRSADEKPRWLDRPGSVDWLIRALGAAAALTVLADFFYHKHVDYGFQSWPGFDAGFGFVSCVALVLAAKQLRRLLMRDEDYYDG